MNRQSKGYVWEIKVKKKLISMGFILERLGGSTTELPDLVAHRDSDKLIIGIECKRISGKNVLIPAKQLQRCIDETEKWGLYKNKMVILAFQFSKFGLKKSKDYREKREYLKIWNYKYDVNTISCNYHGVCRSEGNVIQLEEFHD